MKTIKITTVLLICLAANLGGIGAAIAAGKLDFESVEANFNAAASGDIVQTATEAGIFDTLVSLLQATDLASSLQGDGPFTVFAPTDDAFGKLPKVIINDLLKPENKQRLTDILGFHVVAGTITTDDLKGKQLSAPTVNGAPLMITGLTKIVHVNGNSHILKGDVVTDNGIIHVIDKVMLPKQ